MSSQISKTAPESPASFTGFAATSSSKPDRRGDPGCRANLDRQSDLNRVGRDGFLSLEFERRGARTALSRCRYTLPLQAQRAVSLDDGTAYAMLLNPTGGVLGGDLLSTRIRLAEGARACLTTPSATRVYRALRHPSVQETQIDVGEAASLEFLPDHIIPHAGASFRQLLRVELARTGRAILFDSCSAGRIAHGERWLFRDFDSRTEIFLAGKPVFLNRTLIEPHVRPPSLDFGIAEFHYFATALFVAGDFAAWKGLLSTLYSVLSKQPGIYAGASLLAHHGCVARFLARTASDLAETNGALWSAARPLLLGSPAFDLRKY